MRKKIITSFIGAMVCWAGINGQRYFVSNQYSYDLFLANPSAVALKNDCYSVNGYFQKQWLGTDLAPATQMLTFQKGFPSNLGIGTYVYNDRNGYHGELSVQQSAGYKIKLSQTRRVKSNLLFGMSLLMEQRSLDMTNFGDAGAIDPAMGGGKATGYGFNANAGMMLLINSWQIGFSTTNILNNTNSLYSGDEEPKVPMDLNFHVGTFFKISDRNLYLEPLFFYRRNAYLDSRTDMNLKFTMPTLSPDFAWWGQLAYRRTMDKSWGDNLGLATTLGIMKRGFSVGVEFQLGLTKAQHDYGSAYQLVAGYRFCRDRSNSPIPCSKDKNVQKVGDKGKK